MEEPIIETLIDEYLLGTISAGDKARLEQLIATDPAIAEQVQDSKRAYKALLIERNRMLKGKLKQLDQQGFYEQRFVSRKLGIFIFMAAAVILLFWLANLYSSPSCIARRHLAEYPGQANVNGLTERNASDWHQAKSAFLKNDFQSAIQQYVVISGDADTPGHFEARWNILMAQLAAEGPTSAWYLAMEAFAQEAPDPWSAKANALPEVFKATYYKLLFSPLKDKLSHLKPRLI